MNDKKTTILIALIEEFIISNNKGKYELRDSDLSRISEILELIHQHSDLNPDKIKRLKNDDKSVKEILAMLKSLEEDTDSTYNDLYRDLERYVDLNIYTDTVIEANTDLINQIIDYFEQHEAYEKCHKLKQAKEKLKNDKECGV
jgi:hypothetical protein